MAIAANLTIRGINDGVVSATGSRVAHASDPAKTLRSKAKFAATDSIVARCVRG